MWIGRGCYLQGSVLVGASFSSCLRTLAFSLALSRLWMALQYPGPSGVQVWPLPGPGPLSGLWSAVCPPSSASPSSLSPSVSSSPCAPVPDAPVGVTLKRSVGKRSVCVCIQCVRVCVFNLLQSLSLLLFQATQVLLFLLLGALLFLLHVSQSLLHGFHCGLAGSLLLLLFLLVPLLLLLVFLALLVYPFLF